MTHVRQIVFGDFVLDVSGRMLRHRSTPVLLRPKEFELLLLLALSRGAAVSKEAIIDVVWHSADVSDSAITQSIYRLRQTLSRHDPNTNHIATIPGRGYRFAS